MRIKRLGTLVTLGETRFSSNLSVDYVGQVTQGQWHKAELNTRITLLECLSGAYCRRHRQITTLNTVSTLFIRNSKLDIEKPKAYLNKHALSFVNALCKSTHTLDQRYTTPRVTENDAPYLCVYVCVVCVGGSVSNENILLSQRVPNKTPIRENRSPSSAYIDNVYIGV